MLEVFGKNIIFFQLKSNFFKRVICSLIIFIVHNPFGCSTYVWLPIVSLMIFVNFLSGGLSFALAMLSAQGSIMEMEKRRHVSTLLYARLPVFFVEVIWTIITTLLSFSKFFEII